MQGPYELVKDGDKNKIIEPPRLSSEEKVKAADESVEKLEELYEEKVEIVDKSTETLEELYEEKVEVIDKSAEKLEKLYEDKDELNLASEICNNNLKLMCPYCWKNFDNNCDLKTHMTVHNNFYPYKCTICDLYLETETLFKSHMLLHEGNKDFFHCADSSFKSAKVSSLKYHQMKWHADVYKCQFCSELFKNKAVYLKHMELHNVTILCDVCGQIFKADCHLTQHKCKSQNDENDIHKQLQRKDECQDDEKHSIKINESEKFNLQKYNNNESLDELNRDLDLLNEKRFKCSQCRWRFKSMNVLKKHKKRHLRNFKCNECDAVFKYRASFLKHKKKYKHKNEY